MAKITQKTEVFFIDPDDDSVVKVTKVKSFNPGGNPADQLETTDLDSTSKEYLAGLRTPSAASMAINADPEEASHLRLHELTLEDPSPVLKWAVGWSDGTTAPTADTSGDFVLPTDRTWFTFEGYVADFPFDFTTNSIVASDVSIQRSGNAAWTAKSA